jgi:hypothetical protein
MAIFSLNAERQMAPKIYQLFSFWPIKSLHEQKVAGVMG